MKHPRNAAVRSTRANSVFPKSNSKNSMEMSKIELDSGDSFEKSMTTRESISKRFALSKI